MREVDGRETGVGLVRLELIELGTGVLRTFSTFSDGEFYIIGVKPGDYELRLAEQPLLTDLTSEPATVRVTLRPSPEGPRVGGLVLKLVPRP